MNITLKIDPEIQPDLAVAADFLEEHAFTDAANVLRDLAALDAAPRSEILVRVRPKDADFSLPALHEFARTHLDRLRADGRPLECSIDAHFDIDAYLITLRETQCDRPRGAQGRRSGSDLRNHPDPWQHFARILDALVSTIRLTPTIPGQPPPESHFDPESILRFCRTYLETLPDTEGFQLSIQGLTAEILELELRAPQSPHWYVHQVLDRRQLRRDPDPGGTLRGVITAMLRRLRVVMAGPARPS